MVMQLSMALRSYANESTSWDHLTEWAQCLEDCGVDRVVVSEHVVFGTNMGAYSNPGVGGTAGGRQPTGPDGHWLDPLTTLTYLAARTRRIRLGTNILLAALRPAAVLAKALATMDVLSDGRIDLGVGVGWQREEYDASGVDFHRRGALLDQTLEICQRLWREKEVSYQADQLNLDGIHQMPKPVQPGGIPVWVSGTVNQAVARRLARFGSGWIPWGPDALDIAAGIASMRVAVERAGGDPAGFGVAGTMVVPELADGEPDVAKLASRAAHLCEAGVTDVRLHWPSLDRPLREPVTAVAAAIRAATSSPA